VVVVDTDSARIETLNAGGLPIQEAGLEALLSEGVCSGNLRFAVEIDADDLGDFLFVAVGTPMAYGGGLIFGTCARSSTRFSNRTARAASWS